MHTTVNRRGRARRDPRSREFSEWVAHEAAEPESRLLLPIGEYVGAIATLTWNIDSASRAIRRNLLSERRYDSILNLFIAFSPEGREGQLDELLAFIGHLALTAIRNQFTAAGFASGRGRRRDAEGVIDDAVRATRVCRQDGSLFVSKRTASLCASCRRRPKRATYMRARREMAGKMEFELALRSHAARYGIPDIAPGDDLVRRFQTDGDFRRRVDEAADTDPQVRKARRRLKRNMTAAQKTPR